MDVASVTRRPLGQVLIEAEGLDPRALEDALRVQQSAGGRLGEHLVSTGAMSRRAVLRALARQHDLACVSLHEEIPQPEALRLVEPDRARALRVVPVAVRAGAQGRVLVAAVGEPQHQGVAAELAREVGMPVQVVLCDPDELQESLDWYEGLRWKSQAEEEAPRFLTGIVEIGDPAIQELIERDLRDAGVLEEPDEVLEPEELGAVAVPDGPQDQIAALQQKVERLEWELAATRREAAEAQTRLEARLALLEARLGLGTAAPVREQPWDDCEQLLEPKTVLTGMPAPVLTAQITAEEEIPGAPFAQLLAEASGLKKAPPRG